MKTGQTLESIDLLMKASAYTELRGQHSPLHILAEMLLRLADISCDEDIYRIIGQALHRLIPNSVVLINSYDSTTATFHVKSLEGSNIFIKKITGLLRDHPLNITFYINDEARAGIGSGRLQKVPGGLYSLAMGRLPQAICAQIEYLLETPEVYGIGLLDKKEIMGSASFLLRKGSEIQPEIVETFVKLASIALKKWRMEEALRQSEQQKEEIVRSVDCLLQTSTDMIFSFDRQGKLINSNKALYNELGYSEQELFDSSILSLVHPDDIDEIKKQTAPVFKGKTIQNLEFRCTTKKGHQIITSMSSSPLYDMAGNIVGVLCIARNISEKKQILEKLRQEYRSLEQQMVVHARELKAANIRLQQELTVRKLVQEEASQARRELETLLSASPAIICRSDLKTKILYVNKRFEEFSGYTKDEVVGKYWPTLKLFPFDTATLLRRMKEKFKNNTIKSMDVAVRCKNGEIKYVSGMGELIMEKGLPTGFQVVAQDITERRKAEERAERSTGLLLKALEDMIEAMAFTVELRDPYTAGHQRRVAQLAFTIGAKLGLPEDQLVGIRLAGLVHDIGKIRVPAEILTHPNGLTGAEMSIIRTHPTIGYEIVKNIAFPWPIAHAILQHHERLDGSGYPNGLHSKDIIMEAKILAVADVVEAMASHRPYRPSLGIHKALEEIKINRGILYDPDAVDCCVELFEKCGFIFGSAPLAVY